MDKDRMRNFNDSVPKSGNSVNDGVGNSERITDDTELDDMLRGFIRYSESLPRIDDAEKQDLFERVSAAATYLALRIDPDAEIKTSVGGIFDFDGSWSAKFHNGIELTDPELIEGLSKIVALVDEIHFDEANDCGVLWNFFVRGIKKLDLPGKGNFDE